MPDRETLAAVQLVVFDFDGVFTDNTVYTDQHGIETVRCWRSDGLGLARLRAIGVQAYILSTEENPVVLARAKKLKIPCMQGVADKAAAIMDVCHAKGISLERTVFLGNDINDIPAFKLVGLAVAVADAYPEVHPHVAYRTERRGGYGAVREVCDLIFHARQK
jgi:3-deoxy-D-manno-octulosonate 8-phosphate phosphatase (KDO 8-P phosphatase)